MKTIGKIIHDARQEKGLTIDELSELTKIKSTFLSQIESESWDKLPELPVILGFVKNIAGVLDIERSHAVSILRRDYPPKSLPINPKPDLSTRAFSWSSRYSVAVGVLAVLTFIVGYLLIQYKQFTSPPFLTVISPVEEQVVTEKEITVRGKTSSDASVRVNNQPAIIDDEGNFRADILVNEDLREITVKSTSRSGRETTLARRIRVELKK